MKLSKILVRLCLILATTLSVNACAAMKSNENEKEMLFHGLFPGCSMNSEIRFSPPLEEYNFHDLITLVSVNYSEKTIIFPTGLNVRLLSFIKEDKQWIELINDVKYYSSPEPYIYMSPMSESLNHASVTIVPVEPDNFSVAEFRVVITGHVFVNNSETSECIGSFIDISIRD